MTSPDNQEGPNELILLLKKEIKKAKKQEPKFDWDAYAREHPDRI